MKILLTLCIIYQHPKILLGMKKRGFGAGRWNGFGGKVEEDEPIEKAAKREVLEEIGIEVVDCEKMGIVDFYFEDGSKGREVHIFRCGKFNGQPIESEEMKPKWFTTDNLPLEQMWPADTHWLPFFLGGKKFKGKFLYDHPSTSNYTSNIIKKILREVKEV